MEEDCCVCGVAAGCVTSVVAGADEAAAVHAARKISLHPSLQYPFSSHTGGAQKVPHVFLMKRTWVVSTPETSSSTYISSTSGSHCSPMCAFTFPSPQYRSLHSFVQLVMPL